MAWVNIILYVQIKLERQEIAMNKQYIDGGVCAAKGFVANGLNCGLNPDKNKNEQAFEKYWDNIKKLD